MAERRCANCPPTPTPVKPTLPPVSGLLAEDGKRLWHHALVTCNAVVEMMHVYTLLGAPGGDPVPLRHMAARLLEVAFAAEENNANTRPAQS
jgi:hypothetical protein